VLGVRRWEELLIGKNGEVLFDRPKPTAGCSAKGRRRRRRRRSVDLKTNSDYFSIQH
jgi:hypothetical protein